MGPDADMRIDAAGDADDIRRRDARRGQEQGRGVGQPGLQEDLGLCGVAVQRAPSFRVQAADGVDIGFDDDGPQVEVFEDAAQGFSGGTVADDDDVAARGGILFVGVGHEGRAAGLQPAGQAFELREEEGIEGDGQDGRRDDRIVDFRAEETVGRAHSGEDEGEFPDLPQREAHGQRFTRRSAEQAADGKGGQGLDEDDDGEGQEHERPVVQQGQRIEEHTHGNEEEHGKGVAQGEGLGGGPGAEIGLADHHARQEGPQRHGGVEEQGRAHGDAQRQRQHGQREEIARAGAGHPAEQQRDELLSGQQHEGRQARQFEDGQPQRAPERSGIRGEEGGQQHQQQDGEEVLHHQPAQRHMSGAGVEQAVVAHDAGQHHGACHGDGHAEHQSGRETASQQTKGGGSGQRGHGDLDERAADGDMPHGQQVLEMEMQPDPEHEQDDADLRALGGGGGVRHETRRMGTDQHAGQQVAHQRGETQLLREEAQRRGGRQTTCQRQDEIDIMRHTHRGTSRSRGCRGGLRPARCGKGTRPAPPSGWTARAGGSGEVSRRQRGPGSHCAQTERRRGPSPSQR